MAQPLTPLSEASHNPRIRSSAPKINDDDDSLAFLKLPTANPMLPSPRILEDSSDTSLTEQACSSPFVSNPGELPQEFFEKAVERTSPRILFKTESGHSSSESISFTTASPCKMKLASSPSKTPLRDNQGPNRAFSLMEDEAGTAFCEEGDSFSTEGNCSDIGDIDETGFSTFSAVPNVDMTAFARQGQRGDSPTASPSKKSQRSSLNRQRTPRTPRISKQHGSNSSSSMSPTPRQRSGADEKGDSTDLLLDFTAQINALASSTSFSFVSPTRHLTQTPTRSRTQPDLLSLGNRNTMPSPSKCALPPATPTERLRLANLLDFDIPPAPTPRSVPTVTPRELESLKSEYLSQISSLTATLSGKEAEVTSLKGAVGDAERRVGEAQERLRDEQAAREALQADKESWEHRGREIESVLRSVKAELLHGESEIERMTANLEESERRREESDTKAAEAESRLAGLKAGSSKSTGEDTDGPSNDVSLAVERVSRELHSLYKSKHESKVGALKKAYESRYDKKVKDLEEKVDELNRENEELRSSKDAAFSGVIPPAPKDGAVEIDEERRAAEVQRAEEQKARLLGLESELGSVKCDRDRLLQSLEVERREKGEMVGAVEELLSMMAAANAGDPAAMTEVDNFRGSISRASALRPIAPKTSIAASGESKIGRVNLNGTHGGLGHTGSRKIGVPASGRSGIMGNIERMGRGRVD
ncbi:MAG: hypothetical protein M1825_000735 [Sarcosagium campestre]|nr:MAG: hypothetical protein M1825_000735 [Sarcosagium campestre]